MKIFRIPLSAVLLLLCSNAFVYAQLRPQDQALFDAIANHNAQQVEDALDQGANTEARLPAGSGVLTFATPLIAAAQHGFPEALQMLLDHHAKIEATDQFGDTALAEAAESYNSHAVKILLDAHANLEVRTFGACHIDNSDYQETPLMDAACLGSADVVKVLLDYGASTEAKDNHGHNALFLAMRAGKADVVQLLLARSASATAIPEEARRPFVQANTLFKAAQSDADMKAVLALYEQAVEQAPRFADAWYNQSLAQEKAGDYANAEISMKNFQMLEPGGTTDRATLDRIYALEASAEKARQQASFNETAGSVRNIIGGYTLYKFFVMQRQDRTGCSLNEAVAGQCYVFPSDQYGYSDHDGSPIGAQAAVTTDSDHVILTLGTQRFCMPPSVVNYAIGNPQVHWNDRNEPGLTDCNVPPGDVRVLTFAFKPIALDGQKSTERSALSGTRSIVAVKCPNPECSPIDISIYWLKP